MCETTNRHRRVRLETDQPHRGGGVMTRVRHISTTGDVGTSSHRTAHTGPASATVYVGSDDGERPNRHDPSITLVVDGDGVWQVIGQTGDDGPPRILTSGHVDQLGDAA